jgi:paraquat-inducible protein B
MDKMPIEKIGEDLQAAVHGARRLVDSPELARSLKNLDATIEEARLMISDLRSTVAPQLNATLTEARQTMENAGEMLRSDSPLQIRLKSTLDEIARASRSMRQLMDYLERHPESVISGKGSDE